VTFIVRDDGEIPFYAEPRSWASGDEKAWVHSLVEAEPEAVDELWAIRKDVARVAELLIERQGPRLRAALEEREAVDEARYTSVLSYLDAELPRLRPLWAQLDRSALPALPWKRLSQCVDVCRGLLPFRSPATEASFKARHGYMSQLVLVLLDPERATFGAAYDSQNAIIEDAVSTLARTPLRDVGLREDVEYLRPTIRKLLSQRAAKRAFAGNETYWIVRADDAAALRERLANVTGETVESDAEETLRVRRLDEALAGIDGTCLMALTKWADYESGRGEDLGLTSLRGAWRVVPRRKPRGTS
jgi:hypothetical protein